MVPRFAIPSVLLLVLALPAALAPAKGANVPHYYAGEILTNCNLSSCWQPLVLGVKGTISIGFQRVDQTPGSTQSIAYWLGLETTAGTWVQAGYCLGNAPCQSAFAPDGSPIPELYVEWNDLGAYNFAPVAQAQFGQPHDFAVFLANYGGANHMNVTIDGNLVASPVTDITSGAADAELEAFQADTTQAGGQFKGMQALYQCMACPLPDGGWYSWNQAPLFTWTGNGFHETLPYMVSIDSFDHFAPSFIGFTRGRPPCCYNK